MYHVRQHSNFNYIILKSNAIIKSILLLASMLTILANAIIAPALPEIKNAFASINNIEIISKLLMTLPALTIAVFASSIGSLLDKVGKVKILLASLLLFSIAGISGFWLPNLPLILVGRFLLGFGVAGIMTSVTTLIGDFYKGEERQEFISWQGAFMGFGGLLFITLAGFLADQNWRFPFLVYAFALIPLLLASKYLKEPITLKKMETIDVVNQGSINKKTLYSIYFSAFIGIALFYILPLQIPFYLKTFSTVSNSMSGFAIGALTTAQAISSFFYKNLKSKFSYKTIYSYSFTVMAIGFALIGFGTNYWQIIFGLVISGIGTAWLMPNANLWLMAVTPENSRGKFIGQLTTFIFLGQFMSPILVQPIQVEFGIKNTFLILSSFLIALVIYYSQKK